MKTLITGSRNASGRLLMIVQQYIMAHKDDEYIVGDADGVDNITILACDSVQAKVTVYGANNKMRHSTRFGNNVPMSCVYSERDKFMVERAPDVCIAFWDGQSKGTLATARYAKQRGIKTYVVK